MVRDYTERLYVPAAKAVQARTANGAALAKELEAWRARIDARWRGLRFGAVTVRSADGRHRFEVELQLGELAVDDIRVELFAEPVDAAGAPERYQAARAGAGPPGAGATVYTVEIAAARPATDYTARVVPHHPGALLPLEAPQILWQR
jgi:starch phosphorylase